jgi:hypothetical protein
MDPVNKKLVNSNKSLKHNKWQPRKDLVKPTKRIQMKGNITPVAVLINKLYWIIIVWRFSRIIISSKIIKMCKGKTIKLKKEALPKIRAKVHSNISSKIISSNNNTFKVMKFQDQALTPLLKENLLKPGQTPLAIKITLALQPTIK